MKEIKLAGGQIAIVDDCDYERVNKLKWFLSSSGYAVRSERVKWKKNCIRVYMHRFILGLKYGDKLHVDHKNSDKLLNTRENLRACSQSQNGGNQRKQLTNSSGYKGVWRKSKLLWAAEIRKNGKRHAVKYFRDKVEAARCYDAMAKELFGEFARLNFPEE